MRPVLGSVMQDEDGVEDLVSGSKGDAEPVTVLSPLFAAFFAPLFSCDAAVFPALSQSGQHFLSLTLIYSFLIPEESTHNGNVISAKRGRVVFSLPSFAAVLSDHVRSCARIAFHSRSSSASGRKEKNAERTSFSQGDVCVFVVQKDWDSGDG